MQVPEHSPSALDGAPPRGRWVTLVLAGATLSTVPLLVLFVLTGRQMVAGIMQGAVKG